VCQVKFAPFPDYRSASPEFDLILKCLSGNPDFSAIRRLSRGSLDWTTFLDLCRSHSVRPLVHRVFALVGSDTLPPEVYASLEHFTRRNTLRNAILTVELLRVVATLRQKGIENATFKGPLLAQHAYGSIGLREFVDIDIMVREKDFPLAERFLNEEGYETADRNPEYLARLGQITLTRPGELCSIDLHWKLSPFGMSFPFSENEIWSKLQKLPLSGSDVSTLAWDHTALFLAFHGFKERWSSLKWICDFAALASSRPELDWEDLRARAERNHCSRSLLVAASLSHALGLAAPDQLLGAARHDRAVEALTRRTIARLADREKPEDDLTIFFETAAGLERRRDKLRLAATMLTTLTVSDLTLIQLPRRLRGLYYLIRPFRLVGKALNLLIRGRTRNSS
jgi:hypothetical protein